jgi:hypothetical protein
VHGHGSAAPDVDGVDLPAALHLGAGRTSALDQRRGQLPGPTDGHRKTAVLGEHDEQKAHHAAAGRVDGSVSMQRVAEQQQPGGIPIKQLLAHHSGRQHQQPSEPQRLRGAQLP